MFAVRIVTADYYLATPLKGLDVCYSEFRKAEVRKVPVVRIFGATPAGQKTCLHLHGVFPYIYVPYDGCGQQLERHLRQLAFSIDRALNVALGNPSSSIQHVFKVSLVSGTVCELLQGGAIMNKSYQPHEAHLPYLLQLFIDYNLYGMNLINLASIKFRKARRKDETQQEGTLCDDRDKTLRNRVSTNLWKSPATSKAHLSGSFIGGTFVQWEEDEIPSPLVLEGVERQSTCQLEVDAVAADILNRLEIEAQVGRNPGLQSIWEDEKQRRREKNESSQIEPPESQDRGFMQATDSEKVFKKRLKEILKQNDFSVTLSGSIDGSEGSELFPEELTLHSEVLSPGTLLCTPASQVEVHKDEESAIRVGNAKEEEPPIVNEEAILNIMESSQIFQPSSQRLIQSPILESSQDQALAHLLAGLQDDGYQAGRLRQLSQHQFSGNCSYFQNSDDEENEPEIEKKEAELSLIMSQSWDSNISDRGAKTKHSGKSINESSTEEENENSEEEMEWSGNSSLFANLSIPQLDGAADESSDNALNESGSRTHSSVTATRKLLVKNSIFHKEAATLETQSAAKIGLQCGHDCGHSAHTLNEDSFAEPFQQPNSLTLIETQTELPVCSIIKERIYTSSKYPTSHTITLHTKNSGMDMDKSNMPLDYSCDKKSSPCKPEEDMSLQNKRLQKRKKYTSITNLEKSAALMSKNCESGLYWKPYNFSELNKLSGKVPPELHLKESSSFINKPLVSCRTEDFRVLCCPEVERSTVSAGESSTDEGSFGKLRIRYENFQEYKSEITSFSQQETHYKFFPSVVLSNCLDRSEKVISLPCKLQQVDRHSRLKLKKKKLNLVSQNAKEPVLANDKADGSAIAFTQPNACSSNISEESRPLSPNLAHDNDTSVASVTPANRLSLHIEEESPLQLDSEKAFSSCGSKYTLRTKRKINYETEDSESSLGSQNSRTSHLQFRTSTQNPDNSQQHWKRKKIREPPVIIKYIIVNRFKGRKNMLVKIGKVDSKEDSVTLNEHRMETYKKLAPLKDFWPKVPDSLATKYPVYPLTPKKIQKKKTKAKPSLKKKCKNLRNVDGKNTERTVPSKRKISSFSTLSPPLPCYTAEAEDCSPEYTDVMYKLGFLTERSPSPDKPSPPRCWSPSDPQAAELYEPSQGASLQRKGSGVLRKGAGARKPKKQPIKKSNIIPKTTSKKKNKNKQAKETEESVKNKKKEKQKKKSNEKRKAQKSLALTGEGPCGTNVVEFVSEVQAQSGVLDFKSSQPMFSQQDVSLTGHSMGHLPSTQLPCTQPLSTDSSQGNSPSCVRSLLEVSDSASLQEFSSPHEVGPSPKSSSHIRAGVQKSPQINSKRSNISTISESSYFFEGIPFDSSTCHGQKVQHSQISLDSNFGRSSDSKDIQNNQYPTVPFPCRPYSQNGIMRSALPLKIKDFQFKSNSQQHLLFIQQPPRLFECPSSHGALVLPTSEESHESLHLPAEFSVSAVRSPVKQMGWEQKESGNILDISNFTFESKKQTSVSETTCSTIAQGKNGGKSLLTNEGQSGLAVLKELLQKKRQKASSPQEHLSSPPLNRITSCPIVQNMTKNKKPRSTTPSKKPRAPRNTKPKDKKSKSPKNEKVKQNDNTKADHPMSDISPVFLSDPGFESCYSLDDSLSPEHNYRFDINTLGQSEFCSLYSGSQFVPAYQNLPQKFLSDVQDPVPGQAVTENNLEEDEQLHSQPIGRLSPGTLSPDLFDKYSPEIVEKAHLSNTDNHFSSHSSLVSPLLEATISQQPKPSTIDKRRRSSNSLYKEVFCCLPPVERQDLIENVNRKEFSSDVYMSFYSAETSLTGMMCSPNGDLVEGIDDDLEAPGSRRNYALTPTPNSSPRSISSPSQTKNGSLSSRTAGAHILKPLMSPPSRDEIMATLLDHDLTETNYQEPFCSDPADAPEKPREIGGRVLMVETRLPDDLPEFEGDFSLEGLQFWKTAFSVMTQNIRPTSPPLNGYSPIAAQKLERVNHSSTKDRKVIVMPCKSAPSCQRVHLWLQAKKEYERSKKCKMEPAAEVDKAEQNQLMEDGNTSSHTEMAKAEAVTPVIGTGKPLEHKAIHCTRTKEEPASPIQISPIEVNESIKSPNSAQLELAVKPTEESCEEEKEEDDYYGNYSSPDSPVLPPWQQSPSPDARHCDPNELDGNKQELHTLPSSPIGEDFVSEPHQHLPQYTKRESVKGLSSSLAQINAADARKSVYLHSTPVTQRRSREAAPEELCFTPISTDLRSQKLSQRRSSNADNLRRVLLTTQMKNQFTTLSQPKKESSQIEGPSLNNSYGFKVSIQNLQDAKALHEVQYLTLFSMELHARTRRDLEPDPEFDPICAVFYCISSDAPLPNSNKTEITGAIVVNKDFSTSSQGVRGQAPLLVRSGITGLQVTYTSDEKHLFEEVVKIMRRFDPDILLGYEVQMHSWGYLLQRAAAVEVDLCKMVSRVPDDKENRFAAERDEYGADTMSEINVIGRVVLNIWRITKSEVALNNYTFENVAFHVLHQRYPLFTFRVLSDWFDNKTDLYRWKMVDHYISRVRGNLQLLQQLDLIGRTSELARLFGIQFYHVLTRGSQYRVESMMLRVAKPMNYIPVTPSIQQRAQMRAPQCVPLVMEPESRFYSNSVLVLDFQSLYPSIVIAYNYCFSTCLGHVESLGKYEEFRFGCASLQVPPDLLYHLRNDITVSPNGIAFVKQSVRKGVLPSMLEEILKTRIMVKQSMKAHKDDKALIRMLDARQLGLKLIANVTFGYTAANFSGRMPCVEVGDSIVHKARETLERAIKLVNDTKKWGARVVYGDTDSMFVLLKGATKEQAFKVGQEIAEAVTATNPKPVKLKFEKVYLPCVLQSKKRYVGYMYETIDQKDPVFDAKGIETVRRDSCPAVAKILERSIKLLFETRDISQIKQYVQRQCMKLLEGKSSMQDLIFAKEYRGSASYRPGSCVPALEITRKMLAYDRRSEPRVGERVPYVIVYGVPGVPLIQLVRRPIEVLQDPSIRLNATYYITKQILPPLNRIFSLIGIDVFSWYHELPRVQKASSTARSDQEGRKGTISQYFTTLHCPVCDELTQHGICSKCRSQPQQVAVILNQEIREWERKQDQLLKICKNCVGCIDRQIQCVSLNCPVLYKLSRVSREVSKAPYLRQLLDQF
ncbi:DNA polymerase zeta catalytic subunit isoform X2 [Latimeria chalumnae]|uniref:DNA polymerase zeta catalytic subunit isoform X2 n=1 Tax=Latimeria chalumnae TaxID=7897 RepID=UPI0003C15224|nr:PREDICTED: DNA polymerase zeta catalytic subunit isoform X2 [Latimeria chalumnae]|eukprot:XP_005990940.1 PREDICTED: DNA polymerase zeta catalytic subunit isoform X2 [Latimeria chalumnae]